MEPRTSTRFEDVFPEGERSRDHRQRPQHSPIKIEHTQPGLHTQPGI